MSSIIYLVIGLVVGVVIGRVGRTVSRESRGLNQKQEQIKQEHLDEIVKYLDSHEQISNQDVEKMFSVSSATAERYLDELDHSRKVQQIGKTGRNVVYKRS